MTRIIKRNVDIREGFMEFEDCRPQSYIDYNLSDVCIIMSAALCGVDMLEKILGYTHGKLDFFKGKFWIEKITSKPVLLCISKMLGPEKISRIILKIMRDRIDIADEILSVDGKTIKSTCSGDTKDSALHVFTVYGTASGFSFEQKRVNNKTNEIPVVQEILDYLNVKGKIITADAMHCQKET